ncbi:serine/threonine transporter [Sinobacterium caligoides]|uniref:Serine/threonine transporter SstT n=1 Tax=Sinobacterium caligoides TaxID=933926 RepID=A0A3N2D532_9GAMM|nr:serine/threonine transporter SstT [Sinobacterium caligoides]ROR94758.1 serine/threonine transporter [Sinobacterium caligoides]
MKKPTIVVQILIAVAIGALFASVAPAWAQHFAILGQLFVGVLKAIAPVLVFVLVMSAIANKEAGVGSAKVVKTLVLYLLGTFCAATVAVLMSFLFPQTLALVNVAEGAPPQHVSEVLINVLLSLVDNPVHALLTGNFLGALSWAVALGLAFKQAPEGFKSSIAVVADALTSIVTKIIKFAPLGIFGLVCTTVAGAGVEALMNYLHLAVLLVSCMLIMALLVNPLLVFLLTRRNPYPVVLRCLRQSGITAFFTRSSAANIPVNLDLCQQLGISRSLFTVTIPIGATVNMAGAAITITVMALAAANTMGIDVSIGSALVLCIIAALAACGASGVPSGSLLLIPLAASLFGIDYDIAMQVVAIGFIISVIQDSAETALNSSSDVIYTYAADHSNDR